MGMDRGSGGGGTLSTPQRRNKTYSLHLPSNQTMTTPTNPSIPLLVRLWLIDPSPQYSTTSHSSLSSSSSSSSSSCLVSPTWSRASSRLLSSAQVSAVSRHSLSTRSSTQTGRLLSRRWPTSGGEKRHLSSPTSSCLYLCVCLCVFVCVRECGTPECMHCVEGG